MAKAKKEIKKIICTTCGRELPEKDFGKSYSFRDKLNGRLPICKDCCASLYDKLMVDYQDEMKGSSYRNHWMERNKLYSSEGHKFSFIYEYNI